MSTPGGSADGTDDLQARAVAFLEAHAPPSSGDDATAFVVDAALERELVDRGRAWQHTKFEHGWAGISWPREHGGRGGTALDDALFREVEQRYVSRWLTHNLGFEHIGPAIIAHGSAAHQQAHLPAMLRGEEVWTMLFSEPGAGSDLGAVRTRAERVGSTWVVNGQKVWSSRAHLADHGLLVTRSDPDAAKYQGITCFLVDMKATPGVTVRPLRQMNGATHFNEVFLTDAELSDAEVIGPVHGGWSVVMTSLGAERNLLGSVRTHISVEELLALARRTGATADPVLRQRIASAITGDAVMSYLGGRVRAATLAGRDATQVAAVMKLAYASHVTATASLAVEMLGAHGQLGAGSGPDQGRWSMELLGSPATRIGGGTDEVQRNSIGERVLGLPREDRPDKVLPFRDLPAS